MVHYAVACLVFDQPKRAQVPLLLINLHWQTIDHHETQVSNACPQSHFWVCTPQLELNHTDVCFFSGAVGV